MDLQGAINYVDLVHNVLLLRVIANPAPVVILLDSDTTVLTGQGTPGRLSDLARGQTITVTGTYDENLGLITHASVIHITSSIPSRG
jgi:hypothetical protein